MLKINFRSTFVSLSDGVVSHQGGGEGGMEGWTFTPGTRNCCKLINAIVILRQVYSLREKKFIRHNFLGLPIQTLS